jgi:hypothetical protein
MDTLVRFGVGLLPTLLAGCAATSWTDPDLALSRVKVAQIGPDEYRVSCVDSPKFCDDPAKRSCPNGFDVLQRSVEPADYGRTTLIIKCQTGGAPTAR